MSFLLERHVAPTYTLMSIERGSSGNGGPGATQERYPELCAPEAGYVRMVDDRFAAELRQQLNASKTAWGGKDGRKKAARPCRTPYSPL